ncbi:MAG: winged helix-turn-helix transcriptional regulator [Phycisphaerales bacterium]|nr:winged helix-turn-helix transcriptional regulator [Phycisphaerales bacterium]
MDLAFRALADPSRREIIGLLAERSRTVSELLEHFEFTQPALSKHLRLLREAGLVAVEDDGRFRRYRIVGEALGDITTWLLHYRRFWTGRLDALGGVLDREAKKGRRAR